METKFAKFAPCLLLTCLELHEIPHRLIHELFQLKKSELLDSVSNALKHVMVALEKEYKIIIEKTFADPEFMFSKTDFLKHIGCRCLKMSEEPSYFNFLLMCGFVGHFTAFCYDNGKCCRVVEVASKCIIAIFNRNFVDFFGREGGLDELINYCDMSNICVLAEQSKKSMIDMVLPELEFRSSVLNILKSCEEVDSEDFLVSHLEETLLLTVVDDDLKGFEPDSLLHHIPGTYMTEKSISSSEITSSDSSLSSELQCLSANHLLHTKLQQDSGTSREVSPRDINYNSPRIKCPPPQDLQGEPCVSSSTHVTRKRCATSSPEMASSSPEMASSSSDCRHSTPLVRSAMNRRKFERLSSPINISSSESDESACKSMCNTPSINSRLFTADGNCSSLTEVHQIKETIRFSTNCSSQQKELSAEISPLVESTSKLNSSNEDSLDGDGMKGIAHDLTTNNSLVSSSSNEDCHNASIMDGNAKDFTLAKNRTPGGYKFLTDSNTSASEQSSFLPTYKNVGNITCTLEELSNIECYQCETKCFKYVIHALNEFKKEFLLDSE
ncbi:uncharacterized protein CEXT_582351 [Caerostris extrusa]|uniref:Odorant receptor n=1 Tax=Caerostris extrusa TaxID=172846 RepID=A0AAV4UB04_CAEEX|nr:uncharacterized protein CEXT_582351 [Caerostris extrusa]